MESGPGSVLRWFRALVLGSVVLGFGTVAHASSGGHLPGAPGFLVACGLSVLVAATLLERPAGTATVVALTVTGQALVHVWLTLTAGHVGEHGAAQDPLAHLLADLTPAQAPMALAHTLAAVAVGLWLAGGERALWTVLAVAVAGVVVLLGRPGAVPPARQLGAAPERAVAVAAPALRLLARSVVRRGPPVLLTA